MEKKPKHDIKSPISEEPKKNEVNPITNTDSDNVSILWEVLDVVITLTILLMLLISKTLS